MQSGARKGLIAFAAALALALSATSSAAAACPDEALESSSLTESALEQSVLCLINERRASAGIGTVALNSRLRSAAMRHSTEMVDEGYFAHTSPTGTGFIDRILDTGYIRRARTWLVGENLAWGAGGQSSPAELVSAWMNSPAHRANLMRARFREIGIGTVRGTPFNARTPNSVTVSTEYGFRTGRSKGKAGYSRKRGPGR